MERKIYEQKINNGISWLNDNHKGWIDKIDLDDLTMNDISKCVLGQLGLWSHHYLRDFNMIDRGFCFYCDSENVPLESEYKILTEEWKSAIIKIKSAKTSSVIEEIRELRKLEGLKRVVDINKELQEHMKYIKSKPTNKYWDLTTNFPEMPDKFIELGFKICVGYNSGDFSVCLPEDF